MQINDVKIAGGWPVPRHGPCMGRHAGTCKKQRSATTAFSPSGLWSEMQGTWDELGL